MAEPTSPRPAAPDPDPRLCARLLDAVEQAVVATDLAGTIIYWNRFAETLYGWTAAEALGRAIVEVTPSEETREQAAEIMASLREGRRWAGEFPVRRKDGSTFLAHVVDAPIHDEAGRLVGVVGVSTDVTERRGLRDARDRAVAEAERERARLRSVFEHAPAMVAVVRGPDHVFELANPPYRRFIGARDVVGRPAREVLPEFAGQAVFELLDRVYATGEPCVGTEQLVRVDRDGDGVLHDVYVNYVYHPLTDAEGRVDGILAHGVDVTEQVRARREAEAARRAAEAANRAKSQFLANMSHELRTPMNAIVGYTELLEMGIGGPVTATQREHLERVRASSTHLLALVNEILDLAKVESGQLAVDRRRLPLVPTVRAALSLVATQAAARGIRLEERVECDADAAFVGDEDRVRQVLANLLSNAVKFTRAGGRVTVRCTRVELAPFPQLRGPHPWVGIAVEDTGIGIAPAALAAIFEPFVQVDADYTRETGGTGLGLTISRRLARLMGGDLTVRSEPGNGSAFTLWLPTVAPDAAEPPAAPVYAPGQVPGLSEVGHALVRRADAVVRRVGDRLREDGEVPGARALDRPQLEDHTATLLVDVGLGLVTLDEAGGAPDLLQDGSEIQKLISEKHGSQRARLGWSEAALRREFAVLREEVERAVRGEAAGRAGADLDTALAFLAALLEHAERISLRGFRKGAG